MDERFVDPPFPNKPLTQYALVQLGNALAAVPAAG